MLILFVASDTIPHVGGKSTHIVDLMEGLNHIGVKTDVISLSNLGRRKELFVKTLIAPLKFIRPDMFNFYFSKVWRKLLNNMVKQYCEEHKVDFISFQDAFAAYSSREALKKRQLVSVLTMHTYFGLESFPGNEDPRRLEVYNKVLEREMESLEIVDGIIGVDRRIEKHVQENLAKSQKKNKSVKVRHVTSIANFTNTSKFRIPSTYEKDKFRKEFGVADDSFVISCARRLVEKNGVINAVEAINMLDDNCILLIAGDGPEKEMIQKYIGEEGLESRVKLLGSLDNERTRRLFMLSDVSVVPSITVNGLQEATSISALEAMACGLPTIVSNIGGLPEIIKNNETGILVDENNPKLIADSIVELKSDADYRSDIGSNARKYVEAKHSHIEVAKVYLKEFKRTKDFV